MPYHIPALLPQCLEALQVRADGVYIDCTLGGGGHSRAIASALTAGGRLLAFDQDTDALERAVVDPALGGREDGAVQLVHSNFRYLRNFARFYGVDGRVDGVLADLGVSFHHFDDPGRGFSFRFPEGPLDMRMNREGRLTAADVVNTYTPERLAEILRLYGELSQARRMASPPPSTRARPRKSWHRCSRLCASKSTTKSPPCASCWAPPYACSVPGDASASSPTTRSRTGW